MITARMVIQFLNSHTKRTVLVLNALIFMLIKSVRVFFQLKTSVLIAECWTG